MNILSKILFVISISISLQSISAHIGSISADGIVQVTLEEDRIFFKPRKLNMGTGFFVGPHTLVTAFHVIDGIQHFQGMVSDQLFIVHSETKKRIPVHSIQALDLESDLAVLHIKDYKSPVYYELFEGFEESLPSSEVYFFNHKNKSPVKLEGVLLDSYPFEKSFEKALNLLNLTTYKKIRGLSGSPIFLEDSQVIGTLTLFRVQKGVHPQVVSRKQKKIKYAQAFFSDVHSIKRILLKSSLNCETGKCIQEEIHKDWISTFLYDYFYN